MKIHFEPDLDYQQDAMDAVVDLFRGQQFAQQEFTVSRTFGGQMGLEWEGDEQGRGNRLVLHPEVIQKNLQQVQARNGLRPSDRLDSMDFTVEMETGTGKTYVYLRTIFKLHQEYGFTKFVIVVPSIAIKEGVFKTLQMTQEHLRDLHNNVPFSQGNNYFLYDSSRLNQVRNFATDSGLQVMVITVHAFLRRDFNRIHQEHEQTGDAKPIDLIRSTNPIVIIDEPQSVDQGLKGKEAIKELNPLCTLRYSATHADKHHMVYRLDAVDAYQRQLVKQIEVASATIEDAHNKPYLRFLKARTNRGALPDAQVELDMATPSGGVTRKTRWVRPETDLAEFTKRPQYQDHSIGDIHSAKGAEHLELRIPGDTRFLLPGQTHGDVDQLALDRQMIRRTIQEHLDKEVRLRPLGIKVLSLFFVPSVDLYRQYDDDGHQQYGEYARIFEEEYERFRKMPRYQGLFKEVDFRHPTSEVHDGYFSIDKHGHALDTAESNQAGRDNAERAYQLIMRDKERLLSFETPLKFIFSHSALREGWDNPNVFQICALREMATERSRRQTIGRGLRICVDQEGQRRRGFEINTLTVVARERYQDFAANLQKEIEEETGIRFGIVQEHEFQAVPVKDGDGVARPLGLERSKALWTHLHDQGYIDAAGRVQDTLRTALRDDQVELPANLDAPAHAEVTSILKHLARHLEVKDAGDKRTIPTRQAILDGPEFRALWDRIKHKTTYRVNFDHEALIASCAKALRDAQPMPRSRIQWQTALLTKDRGSVGVREGTADFSTLVEEGHVPLPDLLTALQDRTQLTRKSIHRILMDSGRINDFKVNPQQYIEDVASIINSQKRMALVDGVKYQRIGDQEVYAQELFEQEELQAYLKYTVESEKSVYERVVFDSPGVEQTFAQALESNNAVKVYAKLPRWFVVPTPLGNYNPDWAVLVSRDNEERLYFVVETKGSMFTEDLRGTEGAKIEYGRAHFKALAEGAQQPAEFRVHSTVEDLFAPLPPL